MQKRFNLLMTTAVLLILAIPVGIANIYLGYVVGESPCTLCWFERIGMILIGVLGIFICATEPRSNTSQRSSSARHTGFL